MLRPTHLSTGLRTITLLALIGFAIPAQGADAPDPSGTWRWEYEWQGETVKDSLSLNAEAEGKVSGTLQGRLGAIEIKDAKMEGDKLTFGVPMEYQGNSFTLNFSGKLSQDKIEGAVVIDTPDGPREFPWNPERSVQLDDALGTWQFRIQGPDGTLFEPTLKISKDGDKYQTVYTTMQGQQLQVTGLNVKDNQLAFSVSAEYDGNRLNVDYKGRPYGHKIRGQVTYDYNGQTGDVEFTGKRKVEKPNAKPAE